MLHILAQWLHRASGLHYSSNSPNDEGSRFQLYVLLTAVLLDDFITPASFVVYLCEPLTFYLFLMVDSNAGYSASALIKSLWRGTSSAKRLKSKNIDGSEGTTNEGCSQTPLSNFDSLKQRWWALGNGSSPNTIWFAFLLLLILESSLQRLSVGDFFNEP